MTNDRKTTPEHVTSLAEYEVFVFVVRRSGNHITGNECAFCTIIVYCLRILLVYDKTIQI